MFPGMNKKMLEQAMKHLNMKQEEVDEMRLLSREKIIILLKILMLSR